MKILERLDELEKAATEDPWGSIEAWCDASDDCRDRRELWITGPSIKYYEEASESDIGLIVESRNALRALIEVARAAYEIKNAKAYMRWDRADLLLDQIYEMNDALENLKSLCPEK